MANLRKHDKNIWYVGDRVSHRQIEFYEAVAKGRIGTITVQRIEAHGNAWVVLYTHKYTSVDSMEEIAQYHVGVVYEAADSKLYCCSDVIAS